jgi:hypothetical protein
VWEEIDQLLNSNNPLLVVTLEELLLLLLLLLLSEVADSLKKVRVYAHYCQ